MTKSKLGGNKNGLGLYELMTAPEEVYRKALAAAERQDVEEFCELLGIDKRRVKNERRN
jgi:hypothetical protein